MERVQHGRVERGEYKKSFPGLVPSVSAKNIASRMDNYAGEDPLNVFIGNVFSSVLRS